MNASHRVVLFSAAVCGWLDILFAVYLIGAGFISHTGEPAHELSNSVVGFIAIVFGLYSISASGQFPTLPVRIPVLVVSALAHFVVGITIKGPWIVPQLNILFWLVGFVNLLTAQLPASVIGLTPRSTRTQP